MEKYLYKLEGAWVQHLISNWVKATKLLSKHANSDWHKTAVEKSVLADAAEQIWLLSRN